MRHFSLSVLSVILLCVLGGRTFAVNNIPANDPKIQYFGRWDFTDPAAPGHSWPGVSIYAEFEGTSVGVRTNDNFCYYNVIIDDTIRFIFHPTIAGINSYTLRSGLPDGHHTIRISKRNETNWTKFSFNGFILDDGKNLLLPVDKPERKIEFIGDSFTSASGNEWTGPGTPTPTTEEFTNTDEGFGAITARNYDAQFHLTSVSGFGLIQDWEGRFSNNLPDYFDRTLEYTNFPKWDFEQWIPNLVVICLGLNDFSGWHGYDSLTIPNQNKSFFQSRYHDYISWIRSVYPGTKILAVSAHPEWLVSTIREVVTQERESGHNDVSFTSFPYYTGGYVNNGHPSVETHHKIADVLIATIDTIDAWAPYTDTQPPYFVNLPASPSTVCSTSFVLNVQTNEYATVRYSAQNKSYDQMDSVFTTTGKREHSIVLSCSNGQSYTYYIRAVDVHGNSMDTSAVVQFTVDTTLGVVDWKSFAYDDSQWMKGDGKFGVDDFPGVNTTLSPVITAYFRKKVTIDNVDSTGGLSMLYKGRDGGIVYVNGSEVKRINLPTGSGYSLYAYMYQDNNLTFQMLNTKSNKLLTKWKNGENIVAIEVHSSSANSHISFDTKLFDAKGITYYDTSAEWSYYDGGTVPPVQTGEKTSGMLADQDGSTPDKFFLYPNYPNPFNPATVIRYSLGGGGTQFDVSLKVYDVLGREVATILEAKEGRGLHEAVWDASKFSSGAYFIRLTSTDQKGSISRQTIKTLLIR